MRRVIATAALAWFAAGCTKSTSQPTDPFQSPTRIPPPATGYSFPQGQAYDPNAGAVPALPAPPSGAPAVNNQYNNSPVYNPPGNSYQYPSGASPTAPSNYPAPPGGVGGYPARSSSHAEPARLPMALRGRASSSDLPEPINLDEPPPNRPSSAGVRTASHSETLRRDVGLRAPRASGESVRVVEPMR